MSSSPSIAPVAANAPCQAEVTTTAPVEGHASLHVVATDELSPDTTRCPCADDGEAAVVALSDGCVAGGDGAGEQAHAAAATSDAARDAAAELCAFDAGAAVQVTAAAEVGAVDAAAASETTLELTAVDATTECGAAATDLGAVDAAAVDATAAATELAAVDAAAATASEAATEFGAVDGAVTGVIDGAIGFSAVGVTGEGTGRAAGDDCSAAEPVATCAAADGPKARDSDAAPATARGSPVGRGTEAHGAEAPSPALGTKRARSEDAVLSPVVSSALVA
jgi:hypothetical protein